MVSQTVTITNAVGLHARPASNFLKVANSYPCDVYLKKGEKKVNAKSMLGILSLAVGKDSVLEIITDGEQEADALKALVEFIETLEE